MHDFELCRAPEQPSGVEFYNGRRSCLHNFILMQKFIEIVRNSAHFQRIITDSHFFCESRFTLFFHTAHNQFLTPTLAPDSNIPVDL